MLGPFFFTSAGSARPERDLAYCLRNQIAVNAAGRPDAAPVTQWLAQFVSAVSAPLIYINALSD
jgi:hypothetical protein